jgi:hypothetical protein
MALPTAAEFRARFPEYASDPPSDATIEVYIADAALFVDECAWGTKYELGILYYAAHLLTLALESASGAAGGVSGAVASRAVDGVSVSYTNAQPKDQSEAWFNSTTYGQRYLNMLQTLGLIVVTI